MEINKITGCLLKSELQQILNIGTSTLQKYLNVMYYEELSKLGYNKKQQLLTPKQLDFLNSKLDFVRPKENL